jgi:hypothetical protein
VGEERADERATVVTRPRGREGARPAPSDAEGESLASQALSLQSTAGNQAVAGLVQRRRDAAEVGHVQRIIDKNLATVGSKVTGVGIYAGRSFTIEEINPAKPKERYKLKADDNGEKVTAGESNMFFEGPNPPAGATAAAVSNQLPNALGAAVAAVGPPAAGALPPMTDEGFLGAHKQGTLQLRMVKWWTSGNFPGHNAEVSVKINGLEWALAHVKWNGGSKLADAPFMATLKDKNGGSIYGGMLNSEAKGILCDEIRKFPFPARYDAGNSAYV